MSGKSRFRPDGESGCLRGGASNRGPHSAVKGFREDGRTVRNFNVRSPERKQKIGQDGGRQQEKSADQSLRLPQKRAEAVL